MKFQIFIIFCSLLIFSCNNENLLVSQKKIISTFLTGTLIIEYFDNGLIHRAYNELDKAHPNYRIVEFNNNGILKSIYFLNRDKKKIGDNTNFRKGNFHEHLFRNSKGDLLFYFKIDENGQNYWEGKPLFIATDTLIQKGDTFHCYIASPNIPNYKTIVTVGNNSNFKSKVTYNNDVRNMNYKVFHKNRGSYKYMFNVYIINTKNDTVTSYKDSINVLVY